MNIKNTKKEKKTFSYSNLDKVNVILWFHIADLIAEFHIPIFAFAFKLFFALLTFFNFYFFAMHVVMQFSFLDFFNFTFTTSYSWFHFLT